MEKIAERAKVSPGPVLVYSQFVDVGGLKPMSRFLQRRGYVPYVPGGGSSEGAAPSLGAPGEGEVPAAPSGGGPKGYYAVISGEVELANRETIKAAVVAPDNRHGEKIKIVLISKTGAEGLDLKFMRQTHQLEPYWDKARDDQVVGRAARIGSHDGLPRDEREVQPYLYIAIANRRIWELMTERDRETKSIDEQFHERALARYELNKAFRQLLVEVSLECAVFGYGPCRVCVPTDAPLFHDDPALDLRLPDPCAVRREAEVKARPLRLGGVTYYYTADPSNPLGYVFYARREDLGGYAPIDPSDPIVMDLLRELGRREGT